MTSSSLVLQKSFRYNTLRSSPSPFVQDKAEYSQPLGDYSRSSLVAPMQNDVAPPLKHENHKKPKSYFVSPIRTLCESIKDYGQSYISIHDLTEAYNILSSRIRLLVNEIPLSDVPQPCLEAFAVNSEDLAQCISRDVQRILPNPFDSLPQQYSFADSTRDIDVPTDVQDIQMMADTTLLCRYALRLASDIFAFPMLYSKFADTILITLLHDILSLCKTTHPPVLNSDKARTMVVWMLKMQQLPTPTLLPHKHEIFVVLQHAMNARSETQFTIRSDALVAIHAIMTQHPIFADSLVELLQPVLSHLTAASLDLRMNAVLALCGFAIAKLKSGNVGSYPRSRVTEVACNYVDRQASRRNSSSSETLLPQVLKSALAGEEFWRDYGASFALAVVSSFLVLIDRFIWTSRRALRLFVQTIAQFVGQKRRNVRNAHPELWRILIWCFSRLPTGNRPTDSQEDANTLRSTRESAYKVLLQEQKHGLLANLVTSLLSRSDGDERSKADVRNALGNVLDMIKSKDAVSRNDGTHLLERLLMDIGRSSSVHDGQLQKIKISFSWALVDGSLVRKQPQELRVPSFKLDVSRIPPLSESEITLHWDILSLAWVAAAQQRLDSGLDLSPNILAAWQTLLLVRGDLIQGHHYFMGTPSFATSIANILKGFSSPIDTPDAQVRYLTFLLKLWGVLKNVFTSEWLSSPAQELFSGLLQKQFAVSDDRVRDVWTRVFRDLIATNISSLLHDLDVLASNQGAIDVTRQLWLLTAHYRESASEELHFSEDLHFLSIPIGSWNMSPLEFDIWERTLNRAVETGGKVQQSHHDVVQNLLEMLKGIKFDSLKADSDVLHCLLSRSLPGSTSQVDPRLRALVNEQLQTCYPIIEKDDAQLEPIIRLLRWLGKLLLMTPPSEIIESITSMQGSLVCWIVDEREILKDDLHNEIVSSLYKRPLQLLSEVEASLSTVTHIANFIESVFVHIRGDGVFAFHEFWRATYHLRNDIPKNLYPPQIKACLKAWSDFCDDSLADGVSAESESQSQEILIIPASEFAQTIDFGVGNYSEDYPDTSKSENVTTPNYCNNPTPAGSRVRTAPWLGSALVDASSCKVPDAVQTHSHLDNANDSNDLDFTDIQLLLSNVASSLKRPAEHPQTPPSQKRRRTTPSPVLHRLRAGKERGYEHPLYSIPGGDMSRQMAERKRSSEMRSSDDYDTWERVFPAEDPRESQAEQDDHSDFFAPHSEYHSMRIEKNEDNQLASDDVDEDILDSPLLLPFPLHSRTRYRSQTAPEPEVPQVPHSDSLGYPKPLRRQQTNPAPPSRTFSESVDALKHIQTALENARSDTAQIDMEEMIKARRVASDIGQAIDEQICLKISSSRSHTPGD